MFPLERPCLGIKTAVCGTLPNSCLGGQCSPSGTLSSLAAYADVRHTDCDPYRSILLRFCIVFILKVLQWAKGLLCDTRFQ